MGGGSSSGIFCFVTSLQIVFQLLKKTHSYAERIGSFKIEKGGKKKNENHIVVFLNVFQDITERI